MEKLKFIGTDELRHITEEALRLEKNVSFRDYLLYRNFKQLDNDFFVATSPPQLIQLLNRDGETSYINHANDADRGGLMNFISNRLDPAGNVVPIYGIQVSELLAAMDLARNYLRDKAKRNKLRKRQPPNHGRQEKRSP